MKVLKWTGFLVGGLAALIAVGVLFFIYVVNPAVMNELRTNPSGDEAQEAVDDLKDLNQVRRH